MIQEAIDKINSELKGYHVEINLYPSGGFIEATGCDECKTNDSTSEFVIWGVKKKSKNIDDAISALKLKLIK